jgi:RNA polymerase sigma factor (sigma-70 family)
VLQAKPLSQFTLRLLGDRQLVRLAARGHMTAFDAIFRRYHQELFRSCRGILGDPDEAQDAVQNTMAAALQALPEERREIALRPWLHRIAHNEAVSIMRRRVVVADPASEAEPAGPGADSQAEARARLRQLVADLGGLPDRQRAALVMREASGLDYAEIGDSLDLSETRARQTVYEARVALRELAGGREMDCDEVRRALSERDGRVLRGRRLRAHLRACEGCRDFREGIKRRRSDLESLSPAFPTAAASGLLASILVKAKGAGTGAATASATAAGVAGVGGGGVGATIAASIAVKGAALVAAGAFGAAAAGATGVVDTPWTPDPTRSGAAAETTSSGAEGLGGQASPTTADLDRPPGVGPDRSDTGDGAATPQAAPPDGGDVDRAQPAGAGGGQSAPADGAPADGAQPEDAGGHGGSPPQAGGPHGAPAHPSPPEDPGGHGGAPPQAGGPQGAPAHPSPPEDSGGHSGSPPQPGGPQGESAQPGVSPHPQAPRSAHG